MNHFAAFWQSDGTPPDPETLRICGGELARPAGARLDARLVPQLSICRGFLVIPSDRRSWDAGYGIR